MSTRCVFLRVCVRWHLNGAESKFPCESEIYGSWQIFRTKLKIFPRDSGIRRPYTCAACTWAGMIHWATCTREFIVIELRKGCFWLDDDARRDASGRINLIGFPASVWMRRDLYYNNCGSITLSGSFCLRGTSRSLLKQVRVEWRVNFVDGCTSWKSLGKFFNKVVKFHELQIETFWSCCVEVFITFEMKYFALSDDGCKFSRFLEFSSFWEQPGWKFFGSCLKREFWKLFR